MRFPFWKIVSILESRLTIVWGKQARKDLSCWFVKFLRLPPHVLLQRQTKLNFTLIPSYSPINAQIGLCFILCLVNRVNWEGPNIQQSDSETSARSITVLSWRVDLNFHLTLWILKLGDASILQYIFYAVWTQLQFDQTHKYGMILKSKYYYQIECKKFKSPIFIITGKSWSWEMAWFEEKSPVPWGFLWYFYNHGFWGTLKTIDYKLPPFPSPLRFSIILL